MPSATPTTYVFTKLTFEQLRILIAACNLMALHNSEEWPREQDVDLLRQKLEQLLPTRELRRT